MTIFSKEIVDKIENCIERYKNNDPYLTDKEIISLREELKEACNLSDEKVNLAVQTYDIVDKHIRRLDQDLKKFEHEIEMQKKHISQLYPNQVFNGDDLSLNNMQEKKVNGSQRPGRPRKYQDTLTEEIMPQSFEMPIDPNEPTYCICNRVSFGEMIGCENPDCEIEWFHYECVNLTPPVKGKWYCDACKEKMKKK